MAVNTDEAVAERYRSFARLQAHGKSVLYEELTDRIADWLSNEHHTVLPWIGGPRPERGHGLTLALDEQPVALTGGHGQSLRWLRGA
jgi:hypothetical protein